VFDAKRLIRRIFGDTAVIKDKVSFPFDLVNDRKGKPRIQIERFRTESSAVSATTFSPEEISTMALRRMEKTAEVFLGENVIQNYH